MAAADWEEIKRLAADFQRAQLSSTVQRLSERNCVEIIQRLQEQHLIELIYTTDGKEFLTSQELSKEIREELLVQGGRVNLVDLQQTLTVDFSHIETRVNEIVKNDKSLILVLGQLIDKCYLDTIAEEINDKLHDQGQITVAELTKEYDLPGDFLAQVVWERLGTIIHGQIDDFDRNLVYTEAFVSRHRAKIRGVFSAMTRPTPLCNVMTQHNLQERLFNTILEELVSSGRLAGTVSGGTQDKAQYVPDIYTQAQNQWIDSFYKQNGYFEYDAMRRLGISDPVSFIKKRFKTESLQYLSTCCLGRGVSDMMEAEVDEALASKSWVNVTPLLPSILSPTDISQLLQKCLRSKSDAILCCDTLVVSQHLVDVCGKHFDKVMSAKAEKDALKNPIMMSLEGDKQVPVKVAGINDTNTGKDDRKEQRRKKAAGSSKSGGGLQGREVKMKATKKKYRGRDAEAENGDEMGDGGGGGRQRVPELAFLSVDEIADQLTGGECLENCPDEMIQEIAERLYRPLTQQYQQVAKSVFLLSVGAASGGARKKTHGELSDKITGLWRNALLFEKGTLLFPEETQTHMYKHLLRTVCSDIANIIFCEVASDHLIAVSADESQLSPEGRLKLLSKIPDDKTRGILTKMQSSLNGKNLADFLQQLELMCATDQLEILLKKPDKKKEKQLVLCHRELLREQLRREDSPAMVLHLAAVLLVQFHKQCLLHAPGRCVPQVLVLLRVHLVEEDYNTLLCCQDLVVRQMKLDQSGDIDTESSAICEQLTELLPKVKDIAFNPKKRQNSDSVPAPE